MIALHDVTKAFDGRVAVDRVSLTVEPGTTHVLLGSSGSGKSTILRLILGLLTPDSGQILVDGMPSAARNGRTAATRIGYVVQEGALYPHLTAAENASLPARAQGWPTERTRDRLAGLADLVGLDVELLRRYPDELSGGQRQRVGLMRALILDPPALLLDEPLGALDPIIRAELQLELAGIFRDLHKTVLFVTHDIRETFIFSHVITLLDAGRVVQQGRFEDLVRRPADPFVAQFMNAQLPPPDMPGSV